MRAKSIVYSSIYFLMGFILISCDPSETIYYSLNNNSDYNVKVRFQVNNNYPSLFDSTKIINSNTETVFYQHSHIGKGKDYKDEFLIFFDSISITPAFDTMKITKDYLKRNSWEFKILNPTFSNYEIEYILTLDNLDFDRLK